jgi:hypothetical protein
MTLMWLLVSFKSEIAKLLTAAADDEWSIDSVWIHAGF